MAVKAIQARLIPGSKDEKDALWHTHRMFNEALPHVLCPVFKMKRGELGEGCKVIYDAIKNSQNSFQKLEPITTSKQGWNSKFSESDDEKHLWARYAQDINESGRILFDRDKPPFAFGSEFWRKLCEMTIQLMHGHEELKSNWANEHEEWKEKKAAWEETNPEFIKTLPVFEAFENEVKGKLTKKRGRWLLYLDFLNGHPELAAWRGRDAGVIPLSASDYKPDKAKRPPKPGDIIRLFLDNNPELAALDRKYKEYLEFIRPWAKRRFKDGFKHPPTFTMPSPVVHPAWYSFKAGNTYKDLDIINGAVRLKVLASEEGGGRRGEWHMYRFKPDERLLRFKFVGKDGKGRKALSYVYDDVEKGLVRSAEIRGIKLIFKGSKMDLATGELKPGTPYLVFACELEDIPSRMSLKQTSIDKYGARWSSAKILEDIPKEELVTCAIDLGIRNLGAATTMKGGAIVRTGFLGLSGPSLPHIAVHKKELRRLRRLRGKPVKDEESLVALQKHYTKMGEDRFKKGAHLAVRFAHDTGSDLIVLERLKYFIPDAERERGINKGLISWNRGNLVKWIKMLAVDYGLRVVEVDSFYSSRLCCKCGSPGTRYTVKNGVPVREWVGKLFACYECGHRVNADFNASVNLHKIFYGEFKKDGLEYKREHAILKGKWYVHETMWERLLNKWEADKPHGT